MSMTVHVAVKTAGDMTSANGTRNCASGGGYRYA